MKVYRIEYDRRINETLTIPVELVKEIQTYDGIVQLVGKDDRVLVAVPHRDLTYCVVMDQPAPAVAAEEPMPTDDELVATEQ